MASRRFVLLFALACLGRPAVAAAQSHAHGEGMAHAPATGSSATTTTEPGQSAFAAIAEVVRLLEADPTTDWTRVNLEALRQHLIDMDDVTLRSAVRQEPVPGGAVFVVTGTGRTREAIRWMAREHGQMLSGAGITWTVIDLPEGARVTVVAGAPATPAAEARIRGLGFIGLLTVGAHHAQHHLMVARGGMMH